jgi:hypothetical protein
MFLSAKAILSYVVKGAVSECYYLFWFVVKIGAEIHITFFFSQLLLFKPRRFSANHCDVISFYLWQRTYLFRNKKPENSQLVF